MEGGRNCPPAFMTYDPKLNDLDGAMEHEALVWLYEQAQEMLTIVEVGSWSGRSAHALLSGCTGLVYCVDHWQGNYAEPEHVKLFAENDIRKRFFDNVGSFRNLRILNTESLLAARLFDADSVDMVFIDASHVYEDVKVDIDSWLPKCKKLLCGHDYHMEGVKQAVNERFDNVGIVEGSTVWYVRIP